MIRPWALLVGSAALLLAGLWALAGRVGFGVGAVAAATFGVLWALALTGGSDGSA
jgi:hypothetical protein